MSIYRYNTDSNIDEIAVRESPGGGVRMFLHARENTPPQKILAIKHALSEKGWQFVATEHDGKNTLEVRVPRKIEKVEEVLRGVGALSGIAAVEQDQKKNSVGDTFKNNLMTAYGVLSFLGDIGLYVSAKIKQKLPGASKDAWEEVASTYAYGAGSLTFLAFGRGDKSNYQLSHMCHKLDGILKSEGLNTDDCALTHYTDNHGRSVGKKLFHALDSHPAEIGNAFTGTAGTLLALDAVRHKKGMKAFGEGTLGAVTMASGYGAAIVHEKKRNPDAPKLSGFAAVKAWIQDTPNKLAGYGYMISTVIHGYEAQQDYRAASKNPKYKPKDIELAKWAHGLRMAFAVINTAGEIILSKASKGHGQGVQSDTSLADSVYAVVADAIIRQTPDKREHLIKQLAHGFIGTPQGLAINPDEAEIALRNRVMNALSNPWAGLQNAAEVSDNQEASKGSSKWLNRVSTPNSEQLQPAFQTL